MTTEVRCPECGHPQRRHIPHRLPADLWRCNYGGCQCVVRWSPQAEEERHQHVWEDGKCANCAARDPQDAEAIMAKLRAMADEPTWTVDEVLAMFDEGTRRRVDCNSFPPESGSEVQRYDGSPS